MLEEAERVGNPRHRCGGGVATARGGVARLGRGRGAGTAAGSAAWMSAALGGVGAAEAGGPE